MVVMFDDTNLDLIPSNPPAVAGYVNGSFANFDQLASRFPSAHRVSIAVSSNADADCLDCEPGDVPPTAFSEIAGWIKRQKARGIVPKVYCSLSSAQPIVNALASDGLAYGKDYLLWTAHYTMVEHLCSPSCGFGFTETAHATQWTDKALGRSLDQSLCQDVFLGIVPAPTPPADPQHYLWYDDKRRLISGRHLVERDVVEEYDRRRKHPVLNCVRLLFLRSFLQLLAGRVFTVAHEQPINGKPSWGLFHRGFRYQGLIRRANGDRFV